MFMVKDMQGTSRILRKGCFRARLFSLLLVLSGWNLSAMAVVVTFPDANLEGVVRLEIEKSVGDILDTDLIGVGFVELDASNLNIVDLTGLEYCTDLQVLSLSNNNLDDLSFLSGLTNLIELYLHVNNIEDLTPLIGLENLEILDLVGNELSDISALSGLTNLTVLLLGSNEISDLSALDGLTELIELYIEHNNLSDISALSGLTNLVVLVVPYNNLSDISALSGLTNLEVIWVHHNYITDISVYSDMTIPENLIWLSLYHNRIRDISPLVANAEIDKWDFIDLRENPLNSAAICGVESHLNILDDREVTLSYDSVCGGDFDLDGMPDEWEGDHGLDPFTNDADGDLDGDGVSNYDEYLAGTDPSDGNGFLVTWLDLSAELNGNGSEELPYSLMGSAVPAAAHSGYLNVVGGVLDVPSTISDAMMVVNGAVAPSNADFGLRPMSGFVRR